MMRLGKRQQVALGIGLIVSVVFFGWLVYNTDSNSLNADFTKFTDSKGRTVLVPKNPTRIVSMAPSVTEILFAIHVDDRLVGVTNYCNYPVEAKNKTKVGGFTTPNLEVLVALNPDLIIAADSNDERINVLVNTGFPVVVILAKNVDEIITNIRQIGNLVNSSQTAAVLVDGLTTRMNAVLSITRTFEQDEKLKCYFEVWETPKVAGGLSFIDDLIKKAGGINVFGNESYEYPVVTHEMVISRNPDVIFVTAMGRFSYTTDIPDRPGYSAINAVINSRIYNCTDDVFTRPGPRIIDALEGMATQLYPALFS
ncbi:MAG: hypothetical protein A2Y88_10890 [Chloroflexi bacterium RBG_13_48_10]|nr:MAG: hypothetical protein A2Y88_10890 [Chloroflexi bacterium RBG_13_48_10]